MTDQSTPTLGEALTTRYAPSSRPRGPMLDIRALDRRHEAIEALRSDPEAFAGAGGNSVGHALYIQATKRTAESFIFDSVREEQLVKRAAGERLPAELEAEVSAYTARRAVAQARGLFEAARTAAEGDKS